MRQLITKLILNRTSFGHVLTGTRRGKPAIAAMFSSTNQLGSNSAAAPDTKEKLKVTFLRPNGEKVIANAKEGDTLLDVVVNENIEIDGFGACEGTLSCSTCHLIFKKEDFDAFKEKPTDEELDMLDLAYGLTDTSRLGCQIYLTKENNGLEVQIPQGINDVRIES